MTREELKYCIIELYPIYFKQLTGSKKYKFLLTSQRELQIDRFVKYIDEKLSISTLGQEFVKSYLEYAFGNVANRKNHLGYKNAFPITWIVARTIFDKFSSATAYDKYRKRIKTLKQGNAKIVILTEKDKKEKQEMLTNMLTGLNQSEEIEKNKFFNTLKGQVWCVDFTTLYNPISDFCSMCKFSIECKALLKEHYPNVYKVRI